MLVAFPNHDRADTRSRAGNSVNVRLRSWQTTSLLVCRVRTVCAPCRELNTSFSRQGSLGSHRGRLRRGSHAEKSPTMYLSSIKSLGSLPESRQRPHGAAAGCRRPIVCLLLCEGGIAFIFLLFPPLTYIPLTHFHTGIIR